MFSETDLSAATTIVTLIRSVFSSFDKPAYALLQIVYQLFFSVASADLFGNDTIMKFYGRVQVILGVFMMFQLSLTILKGIVNPDSFFGDKGSGKAIITKIITALLLLTVIMPISIPNPRNEYEIQINNNGLLFGTLYSLQHRILSANTIGRIVLGTNSSDTFSDRASNSNDTELKRVSRIFTSTILKGFYRINLLPEEDRPVEVEPGEDPAIYNDNRVCTDIDDSVLDAYTKIDANPGDIIGSVTSTCVVDGSWLDNIPLISDFTGNKHYAFTYMPIVSTIVAIIFVFILLSFCVDIGVRAIKLAVLRLIAPIPIISYMDPKGSKDGAFNAWVKALTTTYIDLFIRLAIVYFVIFLIQSIMQNGIVMNRVDSVVAFFTHILIFIALFIFAKQAPKFIKEVLGMKGEPGKLFSGLGELVGTAGAIGATAAGTVGSFNIGRVSSRNADIERGREMARQRGLTGAAVDTFADNYANGIGNRAKHLVSGIVGGAAGGVTGASAAYNAKDHAGRAAFDAISKRNAKIMSAGRNGGTFFGAVGSDISQMATGESAYDRMEAEWKAREQRVKDAELILKRNQDNNAHRKSIMDRAKSKAIDSDRTTGSYNGITGNYRDFHSVYEAAINNGTGVYYANAAGAHVTKSQFESMSATQQAAYHQAFDYNGQEVRMSQANSIDLGLKDANTANYYEQVVAGTINDNSITADRDAYRQATGHDLEVTYDGAHGLKAEYGNNANANSAESDRLNRERANINEARQGYAGQKAQADSKRFRNQ